LFHHANSRRVAVEERISWCYYHGKFVLTNSTKKATKSVCGEHVEVFSMTFSILNKIL